MKISKDDVNKASFVLGKSQEELQKSADVFNKIKALTDSSFEELSSLIKEGDSNKFVAYIGAFIELTLHHFEPVIQKQILDYLLDVELNNQAIKKTEEMEKFDN